MFLVSCLVSCLSSSHSFRSSVFMLRMLMILISRQERNHEGRRGMGRGCERCPPPAAGLGERSGEFDKSRHVRIFVRRFFTSAERPRTRGTRLRAFFKQSFGTKSTPRKREERRGVYVCRCVQKSREIVGDFLKLALPRR